MGQKPLIPNRPTREDLYSLVDEAADLIRTAVDYKFILVLLFLKRLNDTLKYEKEGVKKRLAEEANLPEEEAEREAGKEDYYAFYVPEDYRWDQIAKDVKNLPQNMAEAISETAKTNEELRGVIDRIDFIEFARSEENRELLRQLVELFNKYDFAGEDVSPSIIGDAYEHILMRFAPGRAKEGEVYTPREVVRLLIEILDPRPSDHVYDPGCGPGGMLITSRSYVADKYGEDEARKLFLYGQERNPTIYSFCVMNLLLHGIESANIRQGDTLMRPKFKEDGNLREFDIALANIPWNQDGYGEDTLKKAEFERRFSFGYPPGNTADWAWIQHMLASIGDDGRAGVVVDNGCLFRGGREEAIRKEVVEKDWIDCVILTPEKLFYNTGAPGAIIILNKDKSKNREDKILFINASEEYKNHPEVRRLNRLGDKHIEKITKAYRVFKDTSGFSRSVSLDEIRKNDHDLNVTLYVYPEVELDEINISKEWKELRRIENELAETNRKIEDHLTELKAKK